MKDEKILLIVWEDACSHGEDWQTRKGKFDLAKIHSVGYVLQETKKYITLCQCLDNEGNICNTISIPKTSITLTKALI